MNIELTKAERKGFIAQARRELVAALLIQHKSDFDLITPAQAGGILDVGQNALKKIPGLSPAAIIPGKIIRYKLSEIKKLL